MTARAEGPMPNPGRPARFQKLLNKALVVVPIILLSIDVGLALWKVRLFHFVSVPVWQYLTIIGGFVAGAIAFISGVGPAIRICKVLLSGHESRAPAPPDRIILKYSRAIARFLRRPTASMAFTFIFAIAGIATFLMMPLPPLPIISSGVLVSSHGEEKLIYIADTANGRIVVFRSSNLRQPINTIDIGSQGNAEGKGAPTSLMELRRNGLNGRLHLLFVADTMNGKIHIIDINEDSPTYNSEIKPGLAVGSLPKSMAITPDGRKLFVSYDQPILDAAIMVFDISSNNPTEFHLLSKIVNLNCPEGIALSPLGDRLYVSTQCGGNQDPVFVIDTATYEKIASIPGMAVGTGVAVNRDGTRLYVSRGDYPCQMPSAKGTGAPLTVFNLESRKVLNTLCLHQSVGAIALSRDQDARYLFVANGNRLSVFDTKTVDSARESLNDISLEGSISGLAVSDDNGVYAFIPEARKLFLYNPTGLTSQ